MVAFSVAPSSAFRLLRALRLPAALLLLSLCCSPASAVYTGAPHAAFAIMIQGSGFHQDVGGVTVDGGVSDVDPTRPTEASAHFCLGFSSDSTQQTGLSPDGETVVYVEGYGLPNSDDTSRVSGPLGDSGVRPSIPSAPSGPAAPMGVPVGVPIGIPPIPRPPSGVWEAGYSQSGCETRGLA